LHERQATLRCPSCSFAFLIAWSDSHWRVFELLSGSPAARAVVKARDAALKLWHRSAARRSEV